MCLICCISRSLAGVLWKLGRSDQVEKICELLSAVALPTSHPQAAPDRSVVTSSHGSSPPAAPDRSVMTSYAKYLKGRYRSYTPACAIQFPPSPTRKYFNLALIKKEQTERGTENEELVRLTMEGQVGKILEKRVPVNLVEIFQADDAQRKVILIEGAPGSGKSTLSWHICQKWESGELFQQFNLVVYVQLRDPVIQAAQSVADLLPRRNDQMAQDVLSEIEARDGEGVLFVMDGWDELPPELQQQSLFRRLPVASSLHRSAVIVTSRPESSAELHSLVSSRIQIVGFTPSEVKEFFTDSLKGDSQAVDTLMEQMRENPVIESSCYLPLNAAIIVSLFLSLNCTLPTTITGVFTSLVLCCILRHLKSRTDVRIHALQSLDSLPEIVQGPFAALCQLAFHGILDRKVTFSGDELSRILPDAAHLSLLQAIESFSYLGPAGTSRTYNFHHLSVQEFLAAWHITKLPVDEQTDLALVLLDQPGMFQFYCGITHLNTPRITEQIVRHTAFNNKQVRFLCGCRHLDRCTYFGILFPTLLIIKNIATADMITNLAFLSLQELLKLLNCIHEADNPMMYQYIAKKISRPHCLTFLEVTLSPADCLSLGCYLPWACCADSDLPECSILGIDDHCMELLMKGLMKSVAKMLKLPSHLRLALYNCNLCSRGIQSIAQVLQSTRCILSSITFQGTQLGLKCLVEAVARNTSLECLELSGPITEENGPAVCEMLEKNRTLQTLALNCDLSDLGEFYIKKGLLCNTTLQHLVVHKCNISNSDCGVISEVLKLSCPLKQITLMIIPSGISDDDVAQIAEALAINTSLHEFHFIGNISDSGVFLLAEALKHNTILQHLDLLCPLSNMGCKYLAEALTVNCSLKQLSLRAHNVFHIAEALAVNTSLQELSLSHISAVFLLAKVLKHNDTLKILRLQQSLVTTADVESLATAFTVNKTLEILDFDTNDIIDNEAFNNLQSKLLSNGVLLKLLEITVERMVERFGEE